MLVSRDLRLAQDFADALGVALKHHRQRELAEADRRASRGADTGADRARIGFSRRAAARPTLVLDGAARLLCRLMGLLLHPRRAKASAKVQRNFLASMSHECVGAVRPPSLALWTGATAACCPSSRPCTCLRRQRLKQPL